jgi:hypothetical protein
VPVNTKQFLVYIVYINFVAGLIAGLGIAYVIGEFL